MQFIDLKYQYQTIQNQINNAILGVLQHGQYILGPEVFDQSLTKGMLVE